MSPRERRDGTDYCRLDYKDSSVKYRIMLYPVSDICTMGEHLLIVGDIIIIALSLGFTYHGGISSHTGVISTLYYGNNHRGDSAAESPTVGRNI